MPREELDLLRTQLLEARAESATEPWELAALAGLLARLAPADPLVAGVRAALEPPPDLQEAAEDALDRLMAVGEDDDPSESWDALCLLDELCAAATLLACPEALADTAEEAARLIRAFPEAWSVHADAATELLRARKPLPGDPAWALWAAVEASRWTDGVAPEDETRDGASWEVHERLGLGLVLSLAPLRASAGLQARAAGALPEDPPWRRVASGPSWELALTLDEGGHLALLLSGAPGTFTRDGVACAPSAVSPDGLYCRAEPGDWRVQVGASTVVFRIEP